jgi:hypothetical protein
LAQQEPQIQTEEAYARALLAIAEAAKSLTERGKWNIRADIRVLLRKKFSRPRRVEPAAVSIALGEAVAADPSARNGERRMG